MRLSLCRDVGSLALAKSDGVERSDGVRRPWGGERCGPWAPPDAVTSLNRAPVPQCSGHLSMAAQHRQPRTDSDQVHSPHEEGAGGYCAFVTLGKELTWPNTQPKQFPSEGAASHRACELGGTWVGNKLIQGPKFEVTVQSAILIHLPLRFPVHHLEPRPFYSSTGTTEFSLFSDGMAR